VLLLWFVSEIRKESVMKKLILLGLVGLFSAVSLVYEADAGHHRRCGGGGHHHRRGGCCSVQQCYGGYSCGGYSNGAAGGYVDPNVGAGAAAGAAVEAPPAAAGAGVNAGGRLP